MDASHGREAIARNARRLLHDARLLFDANRYPTATALAILALEEVGKFYMVKWASEPGKLSGPSRGRKAHQHKQAVFGSFMMAEAAVEAARSFIAKLGYGNSDEIVRGLLNALKEFHRSGDEELRRKASQVEEMIVEEVAKKMSGSEGAKFQHLARTGGLEAAKHRGFYVDVDQHGHIIAGPHLVTREEAEDWLRRAKRALDQLE